MKGRKDERYDLFPFDALDELARVFGVGARKYEDDNWVKGYPWRLSLGALGRHYSAIMRGEDRDPETGCLHSAHIAWHGLVITTFMLRGLGTDDRVYAKPGTQEFKAASPHPDTVKDIDDWEGVPYPDPVKDIYDWAGALECIKPCCAARSESEVPVTANEWAGATNIAMAVIK